MGVKLVSSSGGSVELVAPTTANNFALTVPAENTTIVGTDTAQTLTNKTIQGGTITSGTAVASTSGTSIDFTGIPSWVKRITVMFNGVSTNGTSIIQIQLGTSGGIKTSGYGGSVVYIASGSAAAFVSTGIGVGNSNASNHSREGTITITNVTGNSWTGVSVIGLSNTAEMSFGGGSTTLSGTLDRIRITTVNGTDTFDAGSINILYE